MRMLILEAIITIPAPLPRHSATKKQIIRLRKSELKIIYIFMALSIKKMSGEKISQPMKMIKL